MSLELIQVPGASACCGGLLWVAGRTTRYWICGTCQQPCDRKPLVHLTRVQIESVQDSTSMAEIMFLCQMALEGGEDSQAWQAMDVLAARGLLDANLQAGPQEQRPPAGTLPVLERIIES